MIEKLKELDEQLFLFLNGLRADWLDPVMFQLTETITWLPFYAFLIYFIYRQDPKNSWWVFAGAALSILLADQLTSGLMKPFFERLRPCHDPRWEGIIHNYGRCGGLYGFVSSHAANTFAIAMFLNLKLKRKLPYLPWLFLWAAVVAYTRVYLGVHYPFDIILGAVIGMVLGFLSWVLIVFVRREILKQVLK